MKIRTLILKRLEEKGWSRYRLCQEAFGKDDTAVYSWLAGTREILVDARFERILEVLQITLD